MAQLGRPLLLDDASKEVRTQDRRHRPVRSPRFSPEAYTGVGRGKDTVSPPKRVRGAHGCHRHRRRDRQLELSPGPTLTTTASQKNLAPTSTKGAGYTAGKVPPDLDLGERRRPRRASTCRQPCRPYGQGCPANTATSLAGEQNMRPPSRTVVPASRLSHPRRGTYRRCEPTDMTTGNQPASKHGGGHQPWPLGQVWLPTSPR